MKDMPKAANSSDSSGGGSRSTRVSEQASKLQICQQLNELTRDDCQKLFLIKKTKIGHAADFGITSQIH